MSQLGMQLPGSQRGRKAQPNAYTALMLGATVVLAVAVVLVGRSAAKVAPGGDVMKVLNVQDAKKIDLGRLN
ncbi:MAG: hypothetical protein KDA20_11485 [Phycisphaerales bacterium]|nr:hypothetical protein [Phycisphaerales bacterium]